MKQAVFCICAALLACTAHAAPAPWYQWRSQVNGALTCQQFSPGPGWTRHDGPFGDVNCEKRIALKK